MIHRRSLVFGVLAWALIACWAIFAPDSRLAIHASFGAPPGPPGGGDAAPTTPGVVGLWSSLSQAAFVRPDNPLGLGDALLTKGPDGVAKDEIVPAVEAFRAALGYDSPVVLWEPFGVAHAKTSPEDAKADTLAWDTYPALCEWRPEFACMWGPALRSINDANGKAPLDVYYGCPRAWIKPPDARRWAWSIAPCVESGAGVIMDAEANRTSLAAERAYQTVTSAGLATGVEPWPAGASIWYERKTPAFVLLSTVRQLVSKNWPPSYNAEKKHATINVLIPDIGSIDDEEVQSFLDRGWNVYLPRNTPAALVEKFKPEPKDTPPPTN